MKKWQEERNYRRIYNEAGEAIANIITVDGVDVEVAEDVYLAYSQADRRERYVREEQFSGKILSLEQMAEDDLLSDYVGAEAAPSAEEEALEREQAQSLAERKEMLLLAMLSLNDAVLRWCVHQRLRGADRNYPEGGHQTPGPYSAGSEEMF